MKQYKLLRDLPSLKAGAIFTKNGQYYWPQGSDASDEIHFFPSTVENNPDWFQLMEEKEFTHSQVVDFAFYCLGNAFFRDKEGVSRRLNEWLTQRKNGK